MQWKLHAKSFFFFLKGGQFWSVTLSASIRTPLSALSILWFMSQSVVLNNHFCHTTPKAEAVLTLTLSFFLFLLLHLRSEFKTRSFLQGQYIKIYLTVCCFLCISVSCTAFQQQCSPAAESIPPPLNLQCHSKINYIHIWIVNVSAQSVFSVMQLKCYVSKNNDMKCLSIELQNKHAVRPVYTSSETNDLSCFFLVSSLLDWLINNWLLSWFFVVNSF